MNLLLFRAYKKKYLSFLPEGDFLIQQVVGGYPDSGTTGWVCHPFACYSRALWMWLSFTMDNADSALYLVYRSYMTDKSDMELNPGLLLQYLMRSLSRFPGNNLLARFKWFMELQCIQCLNPGYKPRAKISVLVEGACRPGVMGLICAHCVHCRLHWGVLWTHLLLWTERVRRWKPVEDFRRIRYSSQSCTVDTQRKVGTTYSTFPTISMISRFDEMMADPVSRYGIHDWWGELHLPCSICLLGTGLVVYMMLMSVGLTLLVVLHSNMELAYARRYTKPLRLNAELYILWSFMTLTFSEIFPLWWEYPCHASTSLRHTWTVISYSFSEDNAGFIFLDFFAGLYAGMTFGALLVVIITFSYWRVLCNLRVELSRKCWYRVIEKATHPSEFLSACEYQSNPGIFSNSQFLQCFRRWQNQINRVAGKWWNIVANR